MGIPLKWKQANQLPFQDDVWNTGHISSCGGNLGFTLEVWRVSWGNLLKFIKGVKSPFEF